MNYYLIGIKGVGMTALAQILKSEGHNVTGSDVSEKFFTDKILNSLGIKYFEKFNKEHIDKNIDFVIKSAAYKEDNVEVKKAQNLNIKIQEYPEILGEISKNHFSVAVCGTHGKTTQSAILGVLLQDIGLDPLTIVGSQVPQFHNKNARTQNNKNDLFVAETCEYKRHFLNFYPNTILIPSLDFDHTDYFKDTEDYQSAFFEFINKLPQKAFLVICGDSVPKNFIARIKSKRHDLQIVSYGFEENNDIKPDKNIQIQVPGKHNVLNACGALIMAKHLWQRSKTEVFPEKKAFNSFLNFKNTKRRFEKIGQCNSAYIFDDYAHHPIEIKVTLEAAKNAFPNKKLIVVFESHTFSRSKKLATEFAQSLQEADELILASIYSSAREKESKYTSQDFKKAIQNKNPNLKYFKTYEEIINYLKEYINEEFVVITMGAGNIWEVSHKLVQ